MKNDFLKRIIMISIVLIMIIIVIIMLVLKKKPDTDEMTQEEYSNYFEEEGDYSFRRNEQSKIKNDEYAGIKSCLDKYLQTINIKNPIYYQYDENDNPTRIIDDKEISLKIYDMLSQNFINKNNIKKETALNNIKKLEESNVYSILDIVKVNESERIKSFGINVIVQSIDNETIIQNAFFILNICDDNLSFSIEPLDKNDEIKNYNINNLPTEIEKNDENTFKYAVLSDRYIISDLLNIFKRLSVVKPEYIYDKLNKEYRESRFKNVDNFKKYISKNKDDINSLNVERYITEDKQEYKTYICIDNKGGYIFLNRKSPTEYEYILDNYTIDSQQFTEKYSQANEQIKVAMNINKIVEALNKRDYKYVYDKFSEGFKKNYFKTEKKFEEYAEQYFKNVNDVTFNKYSTKDGGIYVYNITLKDKQGKSTLVLNTDVLMKLGENTDFVISMSGLFPKVTYNGY